MSESKSNVSSKPTIIFTGFLGSGKTTSLILPCSNASDIAIGIQAAVVFPYFCILLKT